MTYSASCYDCLFFLKWQHNLKPLEYFCFLVSRSKDANVLPTCIRRSRSDTSTADCWRRHQTRSHRLKRAGPSWQAEGTGDALILAGVGVCEALASPRAATIAKPGRISSDGLADPEKSRYGDNRSADVVSIENTYHRQHRRITPSPPRLQLQRRPRYRHKRARSPLRHATRFRVGNLPTASDRDHHLFALMFFITSSSRSHSASIFFSRAFSCSSCLERHTLATSIPP